MSIHSIMPTESEKEPWNLTRSNFTVTHFDLCTISHEKIPAKKKHKNSVNALYSNSDFFCKLYLKYKSEERVSLTQIVNGKI